MTPPFPARRASGLPVSGPCPPRRTDRHVRGGRRRRPAAHRASRGRWACSSLALPAPEPFVAAHQLVVIAIARRLARHEGRVAKQIERGQIGERGGGMVASFGGAFPPAPRSLGAADLDRKSVVEGKSVSVSVDPGGRRFIKK